MMKPSLSLLALLLILHVPATLLASDKAGQLVFRKHCTHCHAPGPDHPGTLILSVTRGVALAILERRRDLSRDYIEYTVRHGRKTMPAFKPTTISDDELDALTGYLGQ
jgi:mono/diheme cytochrome c family protein